MELSGILGMKYYSNLEEGKEKRWVLKSRSNNYFFMDGGRQVLEFSIPCRSTNE
jgi:hypothetical protein